MYLKDIIDEDFVNYKLPSMFLATCYCDWKCLKENNLDIGICQNFGISKNQDIDIEIEKIIERYDKNPISKSIVFGGLEPMKQFFDVYDFVKLFRKSYNDDIVIYTGYYPSEIKDELKLLSEYDNIIVKFGRFQPNSKKIYDDVLGVYLNSENQWAEKIS